MKKVVNVVLLTSAVFSAHAGARVIYGEDGRKEVFQASAAHQKLARSTPAMVPNEHFKVGSEEGSMDLLQTTLQEWIEKQGGEEAPMTPIKIKNKPEDMKLTFCAGERFIEQPNPAMCSGFLIAPDLIATAGHCAEIPDACNGYKWVFDFKVDQETGSAGVNVNPENVYSCKKIVSKSLSMTLGTDYAVYQLDRKVVGREPLEIRTTGLIDVGTEILVIGNPSGLPLKVTDGAKVRANVHSMYFTANLDTFQGNSGSAVFNAETEVVEGILVRGENDFNYDDVNSCMSANVCKDDDCRGEDVSRMTSIPEVALQEIIDVASEVGDTVTLGKILGFNTWVDFNTKDGRTALMKAAAAGMNETMVVLLAHGADVNATDAQGNTALHHLASVLELENAETLGSLVAAKAELEARNDLGQTPMDIAAANGNGEGIMLLLQAGASK